MTQDLPLILMNMSGMNGNVISQFADSDQKMKLLVYSLGELPIELLFSECPRMGCRQTDSWIPLEVVPESFLGEYVLKLSRDGFSFHRKKASQAPLQLYNVSRSVVWHRVGQTVLTVSDRPGDEERRYLVKAVPNTTESQQTLISQKGWLILFEEHSIDPRAARFIISRIIGNKVFLHFDSPMQLVRIYDDSPESKTIDQASSHNCIARRADSAEEFIIERSPPTPESLSLARPQNPAQYSDRIDVVVQLVYFGLGYLERWILRRIFGDENNIGWPISVTFCLFKTIQMTWIERVLHTVTHRAWLKTYSPTWKPTGVWKWFWKISNYEPPIPFMTINKFICQVVFNVSFIYGHWHGVVMVSLYWVVPYPKEELFSMYVISFLGRALLWCFS